MKTALIQMPVSSCKQENLDTACMYLSQAAAEGAELAVLPEMFCCPYESSAFRSFAEESGGLIWQTMSKAASNHGLWLVAGSMPERCGNLLYNTAFVFDPTGRQVARHRKLHLFDIDIANGQQFRESDTFSAGDQITVFDTPFGKIGICICFDLRFPELSRQMALQGARAVIVPAAFNRTTGPMHWELLFRTRAVDNQIFTIGAAPAADETAAYISYGNSLVCDPWGTVPCRADDQPNLLVSDLDLSLCESGRQQLPLLSARRTDLYP